MKTYVVIILIVLVFLFVTYMKRNKIIASVTPQLTANFTLGELLVTSKPFPNIPNEQEKANLKALAVNVLQPIRNLINMPIAINSAFRSDQVNKAVGGVDNSQHRLGFAADIYAPGLSRLELFKRIARSTIPYDQLILEYGDNDAGEMDDWIHVSYNPKGGRKQLLRADYDDKQKKMIYKTMTV